LVWPGIGTRQGKKGLNWPKLIKKGVGFWNWALLRKEGWEELALLQGPETGLFLEGKKILLPFF